MTSIGKLLEDLEREVPSGHEAHCGQFHMRPQKDWVGGSCCVYAALRAKLARLRIAMEVERDGE